MKHLFTALVLSLISLLSLSGQNIGADDALIRINGIVMDALTMEPLSGSGIAVGKRYYSAADEEGRFSLRISRMDTLIFSVVGYKPAVFVVSDTLRGREFNAGIYLHSDTLSIGEVIIIPRLAGLKRELLKPASSPDPQTENARYNLAVSAYQGKVGQVDLGDPASNYEILRQKQSVEAYEKGGIPSDRILGLSPFMIIPAAYLLLNGLPEKPPAMIPDLTASEIDQINKRYLENLKRKDP